MSDKPITRFWGDYSFLSNFFPVTVKHEGLRFPSAEHAFQAAKTLDRFSRRAIVQARTADVAKRMGRRVELRPDWEKIKISVMREILTEKFKHPGLRLELLKTGNRLLVEGNTWGDTFWGACTDENNDLPTWFDGERFTLFGENHLGILLMAIRKEFRRESL